MTLSRFISATTIVLLAIHFHGHRASAGVFASGELIDTAQKKGAVALDTEFRKQRVHGTEYYVIDDMLFPVEQAKLFGALSGGKWPGGILYYKLDRSVSGSQAAVFRAGCTAWAVGANVQCILSSTNRSATTVYSGDVNQSQIGCCGGSITLVNWNEPGVVEHEIGHAFGMIHEQSRSDRDQYVSINAPNIVSGAEHNFYVDPNSRNYTPYDYHSIMHYGLCDFSVNPGCVYLPNDPNEVAQRKTIVPVQCNSDLEALIGTHGNRVGPPTNFDLLGMAGTYGPAVPIAIFELGRSSRCGIERMTTEQKVEACDREGQECDLAANSRLLSQTAVRKDKWCDDSFMSRAGCAVPKEMTYFNQRKGARCGWTQTNHVQHREYHCSCVAWQVSANCYSSDVGVNDVLLGEYAKSKDKTKQEIATFVNEVQKGIADGLVDQQVSSRLDALLMVDFPSAKYERRLGKATKALAKELAKRAAESKSKGSVKPLLFDEILAIVKS